MSQKKTVCTLQNVKNTKVKAYCNHVLNFIPLQLDVEVAPGADVPWPPPLEEGINLETYEEYIATPASTEEQVRMTLC